VTWIAATAALLGAAVYLAYSRWHEAGFHWNLFVAIFSRMNWFWVLLAAALGLVAYLGRAVRWAVMIRPLKPHPSLWNLFVATAIGFTSIVLFGRPGELVRPYLIAIKERVSFSSQMAAWLLERIYDLLAVALIFGLGLSQVRVTDAKLGPGLSWVLSTGGYVMTAIAGACLLALIVFRNFSAVLRARAVPVLAMLPDRLCAKALKMLDAFLEGTQTTRDPEAVMLLVFYTFVEWAVIVAGFLSIFQAFPETAGFSFMEVLIVMGFVAFGGLFQIPGVGGGMQIAIVVVLTEMFRIPIEPATGIAVLFWMLNSIVIVPIGLLLGLLEGLSWRSLRHIEEIETK
jgi:glycosyltransferase 2 family protein